MGLSKEKQAGLLKELRRVLDSSHSPYAQQFSSPETLPDVVHIVVYAPETLQRGSSTERGPIRFWPSVAIFGSNYSKPPRRQHLRSIPNVIHCPKSNKSVWMTCWSLDTNRDWSGRSFPPVSRWFHPTTRSARTIRNCGTNDGNSFDNNSHSFDSTTHWI